MPSRYPAATDDVDNLFTVRDNLTNLSADIINRLRDAILSIERTLGINPQGTFADLASRLNTVINSDGSINKQAFVNIGGIFGPIVNGDIDPNAQIDESKLNLNYPTSVLMDSIKILDSRNAGLVNLILSSNSTQQEHITRATGAHRATAIATDIQTSIVQSSTASVKIDQSNVQLVLQNLYAGHINFNPGINSNLLSATNSPHQANQIFYDNRNTELATNSVQGAIDNLFLKGSGFITDHQRQLHSNGIQRRIEEVDSNNASGINRGRVVLSSFSGTISYSDLGGTKTTIFITLPIQQGAAIQTAGVPLAINNSDGTVEPIPVDVDDSLEITDPLGNQYVLLPITDLKTQLYIDQSTNLSTNYLVGIDVFYNPDVFTQLFSVNNINETNPVLNLTCSIYKKIDVQGNQNGLNCVARVLIPNSTAEPNLSSSVSQIQVAHPNAATIISRGFNASALGRRADGYFDRNFSSILTFEVDQTNTYQIQIVPNAPVDITLDTCVAKANLECLTKNIPLTFYRLNEELVVAHNWPDDSFIGGKTHTVKLVTGGSVDASAAAGFSYIANTTVYGSSGNSFVINGVQRSTFRVKLPISGTLGKNGFSIFGNVIVFTDSINNPLTAGVRVGDLVNIQGLSSATSTDILDGSRRVQSLTSNTITVNGNPFPVDVVLSDSATLVVYSNIISLDDLARRFQTDFAGLDPNLSQNAVVQIFMNSAGELDYHERLIYPNAATTSGNTYNTNPPATLTINNLSTDGHGIYVIDCSKGLDGSYAGMQRMVSLQFDNKKRVFATFGCQASSTDASSLSTSLHGPPVNITGDGKYTLIDETGIEFITIQSVQAFNLLNDSVLSALEDGQLLTYVFPIVKFEEINEFENLLLCNVYYNSQINQIPLLNGDLALTDKRYSGTLGVEQVRDDVVDQFVVGPMAETRGSGVASGLLVPSDPTATQNITNDKVVYVNGGVVYVQGVRYEIKSQQIFVDPATLDISQYGVDGYFPGTGQSPGDGTYQNGYIKYYVFVDQFGRLQTTSRLSIPASLPFVPLAKVVLTTQGLLNNSANIIAVNVVDFRLFINDIDNKIEIVVGSIPQQPAHFHSITAALEYIDNLRYNDVVTGNNLHVRPMVIKLLEGVYQEPTTMELPPFVTIRGESSRGVRIRPPVNVLTSNVQLYNTLDKNRYIFNVNLLPYGISNKIENVCFDCNVSTTASSKNIAVDNIGAIKITWFDNTTSDINTPVQLANAPSIVDIENCMFLLDGPYKTTGITTVFGVATPTITGGIYKYSYSYNQLYNQIFLSDYSSYDAAPFSVPVSTTQPALPPTTFTQPDPSTPTGGASTPPGPLAGIDVNPKLPFIAEDAIFTDPNAPVNYTHGGITNISNNTFVITDNYRSICIDRFYDTTIASGYTSLTPIPVSNTRMRAFKVVNNVFHYTNSTNPITKKLSLGTNGIINTTTPVDTDPSTGLGGGQQSLRDQIYDLMVHRDLRGFAPYIYPNGFKYADPKDGYGIPDGYNIPPSGGKITEFMVISGNTPTGLNIPEASPIRFATETQDSLARDQHGGGTMFGTITVPSTGLPIVFDRSMDWHDRYVFIYATDVLTDTDKSLDSASVRNRIYTNSTPVNQINSGISFVPDGTDNGVNPRTVDKVAASYYGTNSYGASHAFAFGYTSRLNGDLITILNPATTQLPGWTQVKYLGTLSFSYDYFNSISIVVMPNGELAVLHAGQQYNIASQSTNAKLIQTSDSFPSSPGSDTGRASSKSKTISLVIQYSPKLNVLTTSQFDSNVSINNLDNIGKSFGKI